MSSEVYEAETVRIPVERLYVGSLHTTPVSRDWGEGFGETWESFEAPSCPECGDYARWDADTGGWFCQEPHGSVDEADWKPSDGEEIEPDGEGPMMNYYYYPLEDLGQASDVYDAADRIHDLPLCVVSFNEDGYALALTGGGMDLSWEICEAFTRLGFLPPLHFCDLPRMAGYPRGESDLYVIAACRRSAIAAQAQAAGTLQRLNDFVNRID